ncbi:MULTISPECIES: hypothetical protein [unclassified Microbacterium]|uniref:hypothetical protein n=1 Tax=unclassified Microbacterium TaxID=2609290 RepID=UPI000F54D28B|nr:hypothetical protein [Microbacterium sp. ABRD28]AZC12695.1 hypothetical protein DT073_02305 [Microbacterium sp. ABRD28]
MLSTATCSPGAEASAVALAAVVRELRSVAFALADAAMTARSLDHATGWRARAAEAFHDKAARWAGDVSGLTCQLETVIFEAQCAGDRAASMAEGCW